MMEAGWLPDPWDRHEHRYWDGSGWTEHVANCGSPGVDSPPDSLPPPTQPDGTASSRDGFQIFRGMQVSKKIKGKRLPKLPNLAVLRHDEQPWLAVRATRVRRPSAFEMVATSRQFIVVSHDDVSCRATAGELSDVRALTDTFSPRLEIRPTKDPTFTVAIRDHSPEVVREACRHLVGEMQDAGPDAADTADAPHSGTPQHEVRTSEGSQSSLAAQLRDLADLHQAGLLDD